LLTQRILLNPLFLYEFYLTIGLQSLIPKGVFLNKFCSCFNLELINPTSSVYWFLEFVFPLTDRDLKPWMIYAKKKISKFVLRSLFCAPCFAEGSLQK
jgi:hypothetical protein